MITIHNRHKVQAALDLLNELDDPANLRYAVTQVSSLTIGRLREALRSTLEVLDATEKVTPR